MTHVLSICITIIVLLLLTMLFMTSLRCLAASVTRVSAS